MPTDPLKSARTNLDWADEKVRCLNAAVTTFIESKPYEIVDDMQETPGKVVRKLCIKDPVPERLAFMARDAAHAIRVPLDHMTVQLALANGKSTNGVSFPIAKDCHEFMNPPAQRKISKLTPTARAFISRLQAYQGGDDLLWAVSEVDRTDKHIDLVYLGIAGVEMGAGIIAFSNVTEWHMETSRPKWNPINESMELYTFTPGGQFQDNRQPERINIAFRQIGPFADYPITTLLEEMLRKVRSIIEASACLFS